MTREEPSRNEPGSRKKAWILGTVLAFIALVVGSVFGDRGFINLFEKRDRVDALRLEIESLRADNVRLASEVSALSADPRAIERLAREQLGLARPDETVFFLREHDGAARP